MRRLPPLQLTQPERVELYRRQMNGQKPRDAQRASIVLLAADGVPNRQISEAVGLNENQVGMWRTRFECFGLRGLIDHPRPGRPRKGPDPASDAAPPSPAPCFVPDTPSLRRPT